MFWMGGLRGDPTLRKEVKNDYKKGQSHKRDERSQDWEVENLSESTLILHSPNIFSSSRLKGSKIIFLWHIYVTLKEKRVAKFIIRLKDEAFQCKWFLVQFDAGQKEALIQANDLFSWFNLLLSRLRHFLYSWSLTRECAFFYHNFAILGEVAWS